VTSCRCDELKLIEGAVVQSYTEHLRKIRVDAATWDVFYECPITGATWVKSYPQSSLHGGGAPVLTRTN